jgi:prolyl-tRNA synthetase
MKASQFLISTLKEAPADAEVMSHRLMMRAGMIKRLASGIYSYMPIGLRVIRKVEAIIREEMNRAGSVELLMPVVQPGELWQESGRWQEYGPELLRMKDRYRQLPKSFYHIQTKFRDERRPRFGLMRGREFTMKDAYSFDRDAAAAASSYENMVRAYRRIFDRFGLQYRAVAADSGAIGGDLSQEFQVIADTGEDAIVYCPTSDYAANIELAEAVAPAAQRAAPGEALVKTPTPGRSTCEDVADLLGLPLERTVKSIVLATDQRNPAGDITGTTVWLLLLRGDHSLNEIKAGKLAGFKAGFRFATVAEIESHFGTKPGYLGPIATKLPVKVIADRTVARMSDFVCGANEADFHCTGVNWGRDLPEPDEVADIRNVVAGDPSPDGRGVLAIQRGIEVGHVFYLGTKYSKSMGATYLDEAGKPQLMEMGCYGIGVTRILGAAIEQNHDERGIIWPASIAPFEAVICPIGYDRNAEVRDAAQKLHDELAAAGVDVMLDDRGERPGAMFADWELIGVPQRIVISDRSLKEGVAEWQGRRDAEARKRPIATVAAELAATLKEARA